MKGEKKEFQFEAERKRGRNCTKEFKDERWQHFNHRLAQTCTNSARSKVSSMSSGTK